MNGNVNVWWPKGLHAFAHIAPRMAAEMSDKLGKKISVTTLVRNAFCEWAARRDAEAKEVWESYKKAMRE